MSLLTLRLGFSQAVLGVLRVKADGLIHFGPPCSSFVWLNRATSGRSRSRPYGFEDRTYVEAASLKLGLNRTGDVTCPWPRIASRTVLLLLLATARGGLRNDRTTHDLHDEVLPRLEECRGAHSEALGRVETAVLVRA